MLPHQKGFSWQSFITNLPPTPFTFYPLILMLSFFFIVLITTWQTCIYINKYVNIYHIYLFSFMRRGTWHTNLASASGTILNKWFVQLTKQIYLEELFLALPPLTSSVVLSSHLPCYSSDIKWSAPRPPCLPCFLPSEFYLSVCLIFAHCASLLAFFWRKHFWRN